MSNKTVGFAILLLGLVLIATGLAVKFVVLPGQAQWPDDVDSTRTYEGTLHVMLNAKALQEMDLQNLFLREVPITLSRHVTTEAVEGSKAIVLEIATMFGPGGQAMQGSETWYAIDRKTMEAISQEAVSGLSSSDKITDREGFVIGFPIGTESKDYKGWSSDYQTTVDLNYVKQEERGGMDTYVFESSSPLMETLDPEMLALFPPALPKDLFVGLAQTLDIPDAMRERFAEILPDLPNPVPLKYTYEYETTYWIEPTTGVLIDYNKHETYQVALQLPGLPGPIPITPVFEQTYHTSDASVKDAAKDATDAKGQIDTFGTTIPLALGAVGLLLALAGVFLVRR